MKPITPNFKKLHDAHFRKMESIESCVQRKTKQKEILKTSVQDLNVLSERTLSKPVEGKRQQLMKRSRVSLLSPVAVPQAGPLPGTHSQRQSAGFRPSVLSARWINV
ncbi:hypothetical protein CRUP_011808 [Coryphaenoides rupestris]|nr:hypothetical protein CRUP_011808 [Coryphaenoides rupestris]